jgi:hypothetical protein
MKIYVTNIPPSSIKPNFEKMEKYLINKNGYKKYELFSEEFGTYVIEDNNNKNNKNDKKTYSQKIYRIEPIFNTDLHLIKNYNGYDLLFDKTEYVDQDVISQLPVNYMLTKLTCFEYVLHTESTSQNKIKLTIECIIENNTLMDKVIAPVNYYFSCLSNKNNIDIDDNLLEEINVFLSELI